MSIGIELIMTTALAATAPGCSWAHPGLNPYRGDTGKVLTSFKMPDDTRRKLQAMMAAHQYTDVVEITRSDIVGKHRYSDLRNMHSGHGQVCHGLVDRTAWTSKMKERGLVYCAGDTCVVVPTVCNNVSLLTRRPEQAAVGAAPPVAEGPLDFEPPAAGSPVTVADAGGPGFGGLGGPLGTQPGFIGGAPGGFIDTGPCCAGGGGVPVSVVSVLPSTPISAIPEAPNWMMLGLGLFALAVARARAKARMPERSTRRAA